MKMSYLIALIILTCSALFADDLTFRLFQPQDHKLNQKLPLLVVLHGCDQNAQDMQELTQFNVSAQKNNFFVLYPSQDPNHNKLNCWNWFDPANQGPQGEAQQIANLITNITAQYPIDPTRIYVTGISAGGAMTQILLTYYSELFAAAALHSTPSFMRAQNELEAVQLMKFANRFVSSKFKTAALQFTSKPVLIIQGYDNQVVQFRNAYLLKSDLKKVGHKVDRIDFIIGLGHAWGNGLQGKKYSEPSYYTSTQKILDFFSLNKNN